MYYSAVGNFHRHCTHFLHGQKPDAGSVVKPTSEPCRSAWPTMNIVSHGDTDRHYICLWHSVPSGFPPPSTQPKSNGYDSHRSRSCSSLKPDANRPCSVAHPRGIFTLRKCKSELLSQARHKRVTNSIKRGLVLGDPAKLDHRYIVADLGS